MDRRRRSAGHPRGRPRPPRRRAGAGPRARRTSSRRRAESPSRGARAVGRAAPAPTGRRGLSAARLHRPRGHPVRARDVRRGRICGRRPRRSRSRRSWRRSPSEVILPMAGWKVSQSAADPSVVEPLTGLPWNIPLGRARSPRSAASIGALVGYAIGAWGGRPMLDRYGRYVGIGADDLDRAERWFDRMGIVGGLPRADGSAASGRSSAIPPASAACRSAASSSSARWARCRGTPRSDRRGLPGRRELPADRGGHQAIRVRHLRGRAGRHVGGHRACSGVTQAERRQGRLTASSAACHDRSNRRNHRLRGGVKVPTGGRLATRRASPRTASATRPNAADLTLGARRGRQGRRSQSGREKTTARRRRTPRAAARVPPRSVARCPV